MTVSYFREGKGRTSLRPLIATTANSRNKSDDELGVLPSAKDGDTASLRLDGLASLWTPMATRPEIHRLTENLDLHLSLETASKFAL
jgi:hypothetical protein